MADRTVLYKHGAKEIAHLQGSAITFMAKYDMAAGRPRRSHLHSSLWDKADAAAVATTDGPHARAPRCSGSGSGAIWRWRASWRTSTRRA